jgi:hypothetical protein
MTKNELIKIAKPLGMSKSIYDFNPATRGIDAWVELWNSINPKDNPWVWVFSFETVEATS